jgi:hypothetical protein
LTGLKTENVKSFGSQKIQPHNQRNPIEKIEEALNEVAE